jgi:NAD(P)-dependent dehydrogenase (short-subunit alcohol dehydrogenase family)
VTTTAVVTGANQGLGRALVAGLAKRLDPASNVYLTGRHPEGVADAARELGDAGLQVLTEQVDVRSTTAVNRLAALVKERHGHVDIVISNAAARITPDRPQAEQVATFVDTNNLGTTRVIRAFTPLLAPGGRFLVVASDFGSLRNLPPRLHARFDTSRLSLDDLDTQMRQYSDAVEAGRAGDEEWPEWMNVPSKVGQVAAMRILAREQRDLASLDGRLVAAVCPGLLDTEASRPWFADMTKAQSPDDAAVDVLALVLDTVDRRLYGELIQHHRVIPWTCGGEAGEQLSGQRGEGRSGEFRGARPSYDYGS